MICHGTQLLTGMRQVGQSPLASSHTVAVGGEQQHVRLLVTAAAHQEGGSRSCFGMAAAAETTSSS
jgi:hypothetical protein